MKVNFLNFLSQKFSLGVKGGALAYFLAFFSFLLLGCLSLYPHMQTISRGNAMTFFRPIVFSFLAVVLLAPVMIGISRTFNFMDHPSERKSQKSPVALLGGLAVFIGFSITAILFLPWNQQTMSIFWGATLLLIVGTVDDVIPLSSTVRLMVQLTASILIMSSGLVVSFAPDTLLGQVFGWLVTCIWILGITNAFNFSDGIDGLASGIAFIASFFFFLIAVARGQFSLSMMAAITAGCSLGFLCYNFKPARIYLGDGGSAFLGFLLAAFALYGGWSERSPVIALGIPALILGVLIYDMCYITVSRIKNGLIHNIKEWLDFTGQDHFHHRLIHLGFNVPFAVLFIYLLCGALGISALTLSHSHTDKEVIVFLVQAALILSNVTMIMIAGRKLYLPQEVAEEVLPESKSIPKEAGGFISGEMLQKILNSQHNEEEEQVIDSILDAYIKDKKAKMDSRKSETEESDA